MTTADHPPYRAFYLNRRPSEKDKPSSTKRDSPISNPSPIQPRWFRSANCPTILAAGNQQTPGIDVALTVTISCGSW